MPYLTYDEYQELTGKSIELSNFNELLPKASAVLDNITIYFYVRHNMENDNEWRVQQFKKALCAQIEYFHEMGASTFEGVNKTPHSFSAGRTTVTNASRSDNAYRNKSLVAEDVYIFLEGTGLLYSAVSVW